MFIELVDSLRCLVPHEDTWLVATVSRMDGRHIMEGVLGCPVCRREYLVRDGVGWFTTDLPGSASSSVPPIAATSDEERVARAAALLGLLDPGGIVVLGGDWSDCAVELAALGPAHIVVLNRGPSPEARQQISSLRVSGRLPFAAGAVRGVALGRDAPGATAGATNADALLASAAHVLRARGRLVAPSSAGMPEGVEELARDEADWVAERRAVASPPIPLRSARR